MDIHSKCSLDAETDDATDFLGRAGQASPWFKNGLAGPGKETCLRFLWWGARVGQEKVFPCKKRHAWFEFPVSAKEGSTCAFL